MLKDPAFLFYTSDFLTGITFMTNEEVGVYIKLLCLQHQHGGILPKKAFLSLTKGYDGVVGKFVETEEGFYNERLMAEMEKRKEKCNNLAFNAKKRWGVKVEQLENIEPLDNETTQKKKFTPPTVDEIKEYCKEQNYTNVDAEKWLAFYESNGFKVGRLPMKSWKASVRYWSKNDFNSGNKKSAVKKSQLGFEKGIEGKYADM